MIRLTPQHTETEQDFPLGFEALEDITSGDTYADETGRLISRQELSRRLREQTTVKRVVRVHLSYRLPEDPVDAELRRTVVNIPVFGRVDPDALARIVHTATRNVYDVLRGQSR